MRIETFTELKRTLKPGMEIFCVVNHAGPCRLSRILETVQTNAFNYRLPDGKLGWTHYPKSAKDFEPTANGFRFYFGDGPHRRFIEYELPA